MMPVAPPAAGPDRAPPPDPGWVGADDCADVTADDPDDPDGENVAAELKNGVLEVKVPKKPEVQPRKITLGKSESGGGSGVGGSKAKA